MNTKPRPVAIVCGGSSGIGLATVKLLSKSLYTINIDIQPAKETFENTRTILSDLSDSNQINETFSELLKEDILIEKFFYSAGIHFNGYFEETPESVYDHLCSTNVKGLYTSLKYILKHMKTNKSGSIVLMSSEQSIIARSKNPLYAMTKGAVAQLTRSLALDNAPFNIRVNAVAPGTTITSMYQQAVQKASDRTGISPQDIYASDAESIPLLRLAQASEIANVVTFLLSENASYVTGVNMPVDGGSTII